MAALDIKKQIRVLLAEDHTLVRQGFRRILEDDPQVTVVGEARTGLEVIEQCRVLKPEVVVMDLSMPDLGGLEATAEILKADPRVKILILSMYSNEAYIRKAFELGAKGYMLKNAIEVDLNRAVKALAEGEVYFSPGISQFVLESLRPDRSVTRRKTLTNASPCGKRKSCNSSPRGNPTKKLPCSSISA